MTILFIVALVITAYSPHQIVERDGLVSPWKLEAGGFKKLGAHEEVLHLGLPILILSDETIKTVEWDSWYPHRITVVGRRVNDWEDAQAWPSNGGTLLASASLSSDGRKFAVAFADGTIQVLDTKSRLPLFPKMRGPQGIDELPSIHFSPDDEKIILAAGLCTWILVPSEANAIAEWCVVDDERGIYRLHSKQGRILIEVSDSPEAYLSADCQHAVLTMEGKATTLKIWNLVTGEVVQLPTTTESLYRAEFSLDGIKFLAAYLNDIQIWETETGKALGRVHVASALRYAHFNPAGNRLLTVTRDNKLQIWNADTGSPEIPAVPFKQPSFADFSPDGELVAIVGAKSLTMIDAVDGTIVAVLKDNCSIENFAFSKDSREIIIHTNCNTLRTWKFSKQGYVPSSHLPFF